MTGKARLLSRALAVLILAGLSLTALAQEVLPQDLTAMLTLKVLTFDRNLSARAGSSIVVGILHAPEDKAYAEGMEKAFAGYSDKKVNGIAFKTQAHAYSDTGELKSWMEAEKVSVLFLSPGLLGKAKAIHGAAAENKCLTVGPSAKFPETGTALGFEIADGKPRIVINLDRAKAEGVDFAANLLQMARVI